MCHCAPSVSGGKESFGGGLLDALNAPACVSPYEGCVWQVCALDLRVTFVTHAHALQVGVVTWVRMQACL